MCAAALRRAAVLLRLLTISTFLLFFPALLATRPPPRSVRAVVSRQCCRVFVCAVFWPTLASNNSIINNNNYNTCVRYHSILLCLLCAAINTPPNINAPCLSTASSPPFVPPLRFLPLFFAEQSPHICSSLCSVPRAPPLFPPIGPPFLHRRRQRRHPAPSVWRWAPRAPCTPQFVFGGRPPRQDSRGRCAGQRRGGAPVPASLPTPLSLAGGPSCTTYTPFQRLKSVLPAICPRALAATSVPTTIQYQGDALICQQHGVIRLSSSYRRRRSAQRRASELARMVVRIGGCRVGCKIRRSRATPSIIIGCLALHASQAIAASRLQALVNRTRTAEALVPPRLSSRSFSTPTRTAL